jgi:hypothetical protein
VSTKGYGGRTLNKSATVVSNDPANPSISIKVSGVVEAFATISPSNVRLAGAVGEPIVRRVLIISREKFPFKVVDTKARVGTNINFTLETYQDQNRSGYILVVENRRQKTGRFVDSIHLKTDSVVKPEIVIRVYGHIKAS